jgi:molecular chaperone GrpE
MSTTSEKDNGQSAAPSKDGAQASASSNGGEKAPAAEASAAEVAKLTAERNELNDRLLRLAAEFENYKRRIRKEMDDAGLRGLESLLKEILPPIDNLDRAIQAARSNDATTVGSLVEGVQMVQKQFFTALERFQVKPFEVQVGQPFDPNLQEAVQQLDNDKLPPGSVGAVFQRGYMAGSRLLRPAVVAVVRARPQAPASDNQTSN